MRKDGFSKMGTVRRLRTGVCLLMSFAGTAVLAASAEFSVSESKWLYVQAEQEGGKAPSNGYVRIVFDLPQSPATNAWAYVYRNGGRDMYVNGKTLQPVPSPELAQYSGHIKGVRLSFADRLKPGRNVLAFKLVDRDPRYQGMILRGDVYCADGTHVHLSSSAKMSRAYGEPVPGWMKADFDDSAWKPGWERGDVCMPQWAAAGPVMQMYMTPEEFDAYLKYLSRNFPEERLLSEPDSPNARIVYHGMTPGVEVNGRVYPPYVMSEVEIGESPKLAERNEVLAACRKYLRQNHIRGYLDGEKAADMFSPEFLAFPNAAGIPAQYRRTANPGIVLIRT